LPDGIGLCPHATVPASAGHGGGTVELAGRTCGGIVRILRRLSKPPGGRRWPPEGGSASLEAMGGGVHDGIGALPVRILRMLSEPPGGCRWPPEGGPASLEAMGGGVHDGIGFCPLATVPARAGHGGCTVELARRPCGGIVRILRRLSEPPECRREAADGLRRVARPLWRPWASGCTTV